MPDLSSRELEIRRLIYDGVHADARVPAKAKLAKASGLAVEEVARSLERLAEAHMLVLQRDGEILMANPFSAVPTPFVVSIEGRSWFGNCIWDAMGVSAMLHAEATIEASCGCCGTAMTIRIPQDCIVDDRVAHFAVPARRWWDNIVYN